MTLSLDLPQNVDSVVISQCSGHFVVVHGQVVLLNAPQFGQAGRIDNLKHPRVLVLPGNVGLISLLSIIQKLLQEVPEESSVRV